MNLPSDLGHLFYLLRQSTTFLVGGCVRDYLMGVVPKDFDIVSDMSMDSIAEILTKQGWKVDETGKHFLVLIVTSPKGKTYEIANFRKEGVFLDGRRPETVDIGTLEEDAVRRDFTVNAIYYEPHSKKIFSPIESAISDVAERKLQFIGKPVDRIKEDYLRVFRFYRFLSTKGFNPDKHSMAACRTHFNDAIAKTTPERIRNEIERMV